MTDIEDYEDSEAVMLKFVEEECWGDSSGSEVGSGVETRTIRGSPATVSLFSHIMSNLR